MAESYGFYPRKRSLFSSFSVTTILIVINVIVFLLFLVMLAFYGNNQEIVYDLLALNSLNFFHGDYLWTIITSMFMHGSFAHIFFNMISLFFIGSFVETIIGRKRYLWFYLFSGIIAGLFFVGLSYFFGNGLLGSRIFGSPLEFGVGASGAIFGLAGLLAVLIPYKKIYLIAGPLIAIVFQAIFQAIYPSSGFSGVISTVLTIYIFVSIFTMFSFNERTRRISIPIEMPFWLLPFIAIIPLIIIGLFVKLPIANTAHFGGLIVGIFYGLYLRKKYRKKTRYISRHFV